MKNEPATWVTLQLPLCDVSTHVVRKGMENEKADQIGLQWVIQISWQVVVWDEGVTKG